MVNTRAFHSRVLRPRKKGKSTKPRDLKKFSRVLETSKISVDLNPVVVNVDNDAGDGGGDADAECCSINDELETETETETSSDELGFRSSKDLVWGKAYPYTWWPGWIRREYRGKFLVTFFGCERSLWFHKSEIRSFETDFVAMMSKKVGGQRLEPDVIDCALAEFSRRLMLELTCPCRDDEKDAKERQCLNGSAKVEVNEAFKPVEAFEFVHNIAVSPSFDEIDSVGVIRAAAQVNAFRRYAFIKRDWIYGETMRIFESVGDSEANKKSTCFEDERICAVAREVKFTKEEVEKEEEEVKEEEEEVQEEEEEEEVQEEVNEDVEEEDGEEENKEEEENRGEFMEQVKSGSVICKENSKETPEQQYLIDKEENEDVEEDDEEEESKEDEEYKEGEFVEQVKSGSVIFKENSKESLKPHYLIEKEENEDVEEEDREEEEIKEDEEDKEGEFVEQVKSGSVICKKNRKEPLKQQYLIEKSQITVKEVFNPLEALAFVHRVAVSSWVDNVDTVDVSRTAAQISIFRRYAYIKHDWIYRETMRLSESTDESEGNRKSAFSEDELTCKVVQEVEFSAEEESNSRKLFVEQVKNGSVICEKIFEDPLHDILKHLCCLALDPFYSGVEGDGLKNFDSTCQKILRYRDLVYQKVPDLSSHSKHTSHCDCVAEANKVQKLSKVSSTSHLSNRSVPVEENVGVANVDGTQESQNFSDVWSQHNRKARVKEQTEVVKVCCSGSNPEDNVDPVGRDALYHLRDTVDCKSESENNRRQKTKDVKVCLGISNAEVRGFLDLKRDIPDCNGESERNKRQKTEDVKVCITSNVDSGDVVVVRRGTLDSNRVSGSNKRHKTDYAKVCRSIGNVGSRDAVDHLRDTPDCDRSESKKRQEISTFDSDFRFRGGTTKKLDGYNSAQPRNEAVIAGRIVALKVDCRSNSMLGTLPGETMSEEITGTRYEDRVGVATSEFPLFAQLSPNNVDLHPSAGAVADLSNKEQSMGTVSGGSYEGHGRHRQHSIDISVKFQQPKTLHPLTMLYSSPLSAESPSSSGNAQLQSSNTDTHTSSGHPTTLHMKFPKDFKLPSKDELVKQFRPFGPIDYLKTKVFFYTGSAQLVFLHHLDAESACNHAKSKKIFLGGANVRFWLDKHEHSRRGSSTISAPLSLPTAESSKTNLKSCLRISNPQRNKVERKQLHVKFPSVNQDLPSATNETKHTVFTESESCKYSKKVGPDISPQMFVLLEKCNQMVTKIKANLGLQSYYSLFTHKYCDIEVDDR